MSENNNTETTQPNIEFEEWLKSFEIRLAGQMDEKFTDLKQWIKREYRTEDEIKGIIEPVMEARLEAFTPTESLLEMIDRTVGTRMAGFNRALKDMADTFRVDVEKVNASILEKILRLEEHNTTADSERKDTRQRLEELSDGMHTVSERQASILEQTGKINEIDASLRGDTQGNPGVHEQLRDLRQELLELRRNEKLRYDQQQEADRARDTKIDTLIESTANMAQSMVIESQLRAERAKVWQSVEKRVVPLLKIGIAMGLVIGGGGVSLPLLDAVLKVIGG